MVATFSHASTYSYKYRFKPNATIYSCCFKTLDMFSVYLVVYNLSNDSLLTCLYSFHAVLMKLFLKRPLLQNLSRKFGDETRKTCNFTFRGFRMFLNYIQPFRPQILFIIWFSWWCSRHDQACSYWIFKGKLCLAKKK
jgi:hypothetical protein